MNRPSRLRAVAVPCLVSLALLTACGGSDGGSAAGTTKDDTAIDTTATIDTTTATSDTTVTVPATTEGSSTTGAAPSHDDSDGSSFAAGIDSVEGAWILVRQMTENRGYWSLDEGVETAVDARVYQLDCDDPECSSITIDIDFLNEEGSWDLHVEFDGEMLSGAVVEQLECFNSETGEYDGPLESELSESLGLEATPVAGTDVPLFQGVYIYDEVTPPSAGCEESTYGFDADAWLFDPASTPVLELTESVFSGEGQIPLEARGFRQCASGDGADCVMVLRTPLEAMNADGSYRSYSRDTVLTGSPSEGYVGTTRELSGCSSDIDGSFVTDEAYITTADLTVHVFDIGQPVLVMTEEINGEPLAELTAEEAAVCAPVETSRNFVGLLTDTAGIVDWTAEAAPTV